jgi:glutathione S-transferase
MGAIESWDDAMKLYYSRNLNPRVAVAVARYLKSPFEFIRADPMGVEKERFRPINPNTLVPILVEEHRTLWETDAIACRLSDLSDPEFWPIDRLPEVMMWVSWSAHHLTRAGGTFTFENITVPQFFDRPPDAKALEEASADFRLYAGILDDILADRVWLIDDRLTYADFRVGTSLPFAEKARMPIAGFRNIQKWHDRLNQIDAWRAPFEGLD